MLNKRSLILALSCSLLAPVVHAEKADRDKPIVINSNRSSLDQAKGVGQFDGSVVITQGTMVLNADHVTVTRDQQGNQTMLATGHLVTFRQKADDDGSHKEVWIKGQARQIDYNTKTHMVVLTTDARVKKADDLLIGNVITYDTETQIYQSQGGPNNSANQGRVTAILQPHKKTAPAQNGATP